MVMIVVPSSASRSMRRYISSSGTGFGMIVVLVAVGAGEIAAPHGNDVRQDGMVGGRQPLGDHQPLARAAMHRVPSTPETNTEIWHSWRGRRTYYSTRGRFSGSPVPQQLFFRAQLSTRTIE